MAGLYASGEAWYFASATNFP